MPGGMKLALIVTLIVIGVVVLMAVLGYWIERTAESAEHKSGDGA
jgi:multisubunit Na+/H+ antiporter MnhC subunit